MSCFLFTRYHSYYGWNSFWYSLFTGKNSESAIFFILTTSFAIPRARLCHLDGTTMPHRWHSCATWMARLCHQGENYWHNISLIYCDIKRVQEYIKAPTRTTALTYGVF
ncbi:hypothetical protein DWX02_14460 [Parabacteroides distasonis]|nr:hypothetical protein DWX02_14460 [Parabacteroides distasonis]